MTYNETYDQFIENYKGAGKVAIAPLYISYTLISERETGGGGFMSGLSTAYNILGWLTLPGTLLLTPLSVAGGAVIAAGNSIWGAVALPIARIQGDSLVPPEANHRASGLPASYNRMHSEIGANVRAQQTRQAPAPVAHHSSPFGTPIARVPDESNQVKFSPKT